MGRSPAAFGKRIASLEDRLGVRLFARTTRRVTLTRAGARFLPWAERLIADAIAGHRAALGTDEAPTTLTFGVRYEQASMFVQPALAALRQLRPRRRLDLVVSGGPDLLRRLHEGRADTILTSARVPPAGLAQVALWVERYVLVAHRDVVSERPLRCAADAAGHTLADAWPGRPLFQYLLDVRPAGEVWDFGEERYLGTMGIVRQEVIEGGAVAVLPRHAVAADLQEGTLVEPWPELDLATDRFRLLWRDDDPRATTMRSLAEDLRSVLQAQVELA